MRTFGERAREKYERLAECDVTTVSWKKLSPSTPYYFFVPRSEKYRREYERCWKVNDVFPVNTSGIVTARDKFVVDLDRADLKKRIELFCDPERIGRGRHNSSGPQRKLRMARSAKPAAS